VSLLTRATRRLLRSVRIPSTVQETGGSRGIIQEKKKRKKTYLSSNVTHERRRKRGAAFTLMEGK